MCTGNHTATLEMPRLGLLVPAVAISPTATERVRSIISEASESSGAATLALKVGVEDAGCSGTTYKLSVVERPESDDMTLAQNGFDLLISRQSALYVDGLEIDFVETKDAAGFTFKNPKAQSACDCGKGDEPDPLQAAFDEQIRLKVEDALLDIRPYLQSDGGDISLVGVSNGVVSVELEGACGGCSLASTTMATVVNRRLTEAVPEIREVVTVN